MRFINFFNINIGDAKFLIVAFFLNNETKSKYGLFFSYMHLSSLQKYKVCDS